MQILEHDQPYIISNNTLILQTVRKEDRIQTLIIEKDKHFIHLRKSYHLVKGSCRYYRTTYNVASDFARQILKNRHKVPVVVAVTDGVPLIMMPTLAPKSDDNTWIAFHAIKNFKSVEAGYTMIELSNNYIIKLQVSEATIHRQLALAHLLHKDYHDRFLNLNNPSMQNSQGLGNF